MRKRTVTPGQVIRIGERVTLSVQNISGQNVRLAIEAPNSPAVRSAEPTESDFESLDPLDPPLGAMN